MKSSSRLGKANAYARAASTQGIRKKMLHLLFDNKEPVEELTNKWAQFKKEHLHKNDLRRAFESIQDHLHRDAEIKFLGTNCEEIATEANPLAVKKGS